jgi:hypothetical protein
MTVVIDLFEKSAEYDTDLTLKGVCAIGSLVMRGVKHPHAR